MSQIKKPRCKNGSNRNKTSGLCIDKITEMPVDIDNVSNVVYTQQQQSPKQQTKKTRCKKGSNRNKMSGLCIDKITGLPIYTPQPSLPPSQHQQQQFSISQQQQPQPLLPPPPSQPQQQQYFTPPLLPLSPQQQQQYFTPQSQQQPLPLPPSSSSRTKQTRKRRTATLKKLVQVVNIRNVLNNICSNSGQCVAFGGANRKLINRFFNNFTTFEFVKYPISRIGAPSNNGFIHEITYNKLKYEACAILKSAIKHQSDNLAYEYIVGQFINKRVNDYFPCFLETYGLFSYNTETAKNIMEQNAQINDIDILKDNLTLENNSANNAGPTGPTNMDYARMCENSQNLCLLIQHIKDAEILHYKLQSYTFLNNELVNVLFQVYYCLSSLRNVYTHYDLHTGNVLLYKPYNDKYIEFHYHTADGKPATVFKSQYIPKIIDYGRSFFDDSANGGTEARAVFQALCDTQECPDCGDYDGFSHLQNNTDNFYFIDAKKHNVSHDLILFTYMKGFVEDYIELSLANYITPNASIRHIETLFKRVVYGVGIRNAKDKKFGTRENTADPSPDNKIYNVKNLFDELHRIVGANTVRMDNDAYMNTKKYKKGGELHVYPYYTATATAGKKNKSTVFIPV